MRPGFTTRRATTLDDIGGCLEGVFATVERMFHRSASSMAVGSGWGVRGVRCDYRLAFPHTYLFRSSCQSAAAQHSSPGWARFTCWSGEHVLLSSPHTWNTFSHLTTNVFLVLTQLSRVGLAEPTVPAGGSALPSSVPGIELTR